MTVRRVLPSDVTEWERMRTALWPQCGLREHREEMAAILADLDRTPAFVSVGADGRLRGFLEASIRTVAEGCRSDRIGYIEGWYVDPAARRQGVGRDLVLAAEAWARDCGCREMASDAELGNELGQAAHARLGYEEVERAVHFRKTLPPR